MNRVVSNFCVNECALGPNINPNRQACVARGGDDDALVHETNILAKAIADYKLNSKTVKSLEQQSKPKAKGKAKAKAAAAALAPADAQP